jgi:hypothetical protein
MLYSLMAEGEASEWWEVGGRFTETQRFFLLLSLPGGHLFLLLLADA